MSDEAAGRRPSIRDVARLADVSHQTVSRVINNHPSIRPETRDRVLEVMSRVQYRPNRAARALVTSRSQTIGILSASSTQYGPASSIAAIEEAARARGYWVSTANIAPHDPTSIPAGLAHLTAQSIEGLVVIAPQVRVFRALEAQPLDIPYVTLQSAELDPQHALSVDQIAGARLATRHLIELGHRNIYHLTGPQDWIEAEARMRGFLEEMSAHDIPTTAPILGDWTAEFGYYAGRDPRRGPGRPGGHQRRRFRRHPGGRPLLAAPHLGPPGLRRARSPLRRPAARSRRRRGARGEHDRARAGRAPVDRSGPAALKQRRYQSETRAS
ncbi:MAG: LacI family transcriptional regulator [Microbacterium sp.]|nr:LacI family transcriptional regulator [Microbacterium sp.]